MLLAVVHRDAPSPMPDLPSLPIVTQAEQDVRQAPHQQQTVEETPFHFAMMHAGAFNRLFAQPRHRSLSPDESLYTFAQGSPSASVSRGASPGNLTLSDCAPSPLPSDDDDLIGMEEDEQPEDEHIARESLSPVVDISELDLGASWSKLSRHTKDSLDGRDPTKPFGPEVFGTLGAEACAPWHPPARLINSEVFDMTVIPASDDFVELEERESSCEPVDFGKSSSPEPEMEASHSVESDKSPPPSRPRASARRRSTNASLATVMAAAAPSKLPTRRTSRSSIASEPSPPRSTRSSGRSANKQQQQQPSPPEPRHTRSASSATTKAQELPPPSRSTRSSSKR